MAKKKIIKVGVLGVGRGRSFMGNGAKLNGLKLVSICDTWEEKLNSVGAELNVDTYSDFDEFLKSDIDAVVLANYFHEHAPFAIKALKAGKHVMSECTTCFTLAEGVALARAVEKSGKIYMLAENYPYMNYNQEMRRLYLKGEVGELKHAECEYVHPDTPEVQTARSCGINHWRNWIPSTYYCTHSIAPVMYITETRPVMVNGFVIPFDKDDPQCKDRYTISDTSATLMVRLDNDAILKSTHGGLKGHGNYTRIHGSKGLMENSRHTDRKQLIITKDYMDKKKGEPSQVIYSPDFPVDNELAKKAGHGGGDFFTNRDFAIAINTGKQPFLDVYKGIDMSLCAIQGWRSALENGAPYPIPDFRKESVRKKHANDHWSPRIDGTPKKYQAPTSVLGKIKTSKKAMAFSQNNWDKQGYKEK
ncbi:MAG: hypothetical protein COA79_21440 [Planctomycetota bacterium]|nr:MAG: hypothetical protein COA79_21440 [Planctomycetota bacterium]